MQLLILIPAFFIFLYTIYTLAKDDYVLIRKNISTEDLFDIAFLSCIGGLLFSRIFYFILHPINKNIFLFIFSAKGGLSLTGGFLGGVIILYLIAKYKKIPLGRLFDFLTLAFLISLPFGFLGYAGLFAKQFLIFSLVNVVFYSVLGIIFFQWLYPKLMNRTLRDGTLSLFFFIFFSLALLASHIMIPFTSFTLQRIVTIENVLLVLAFVISIILLFKQERGRSRRRV